MSRYCSLIILYALTCPAVSGGQPTIDLSIAIRGPYVEEIASMAVDRAGNIYVSGTADTGAEIETPQGINPFTPAGSAFIASFSPTGFIRWATAFGYQAPRVACDAAGNVYVCGDFQETIDVDPSADTYLLTSQMQSTYLVKLSSQGELTWARRLGQDGLRFFGSRIHVSQDDSLYMAGNFSGWGAVDGGSQPRYLPARGTDIFVLRLDTSGNLRWARSISGRGLDKALDVATSADGSLYIAGENEYYADEEDGTDFDSGLGVVHTDRSGVFICKWRGDAAFEWVRMVGGEGKRIAVGPAGDVYVAGLFDNCVFASDDTDERTCSVGNPDAFVAKFSSSGSFQWHRGFGGRVEDYARGLHVASNGHIVVTGSFNGVADIAPGPRLENVGTAGYTDVFMQELDEGGNLIQWDTLGCIGYDAGNEVVIGYDGEGHIAGRFRYCLAEQEEILLGGVGQDDAFVIRYRDIGLAIDAHSADINGDFYLNLSEVLRVIQLFSAGSYHCGVEHYEDGYVPGAGPFSPCRTHHSDYAPSDQTISLPELMRLIQLYNSGIYHIDCASEDGFAPGAAPHQLCRSKTRQPNT